MIMPEQVVWWKQTIMLIFVVSLAGLLLVSLGLHNWETFTFVVGYFLVFVLIPDELFVTAGLKLPPKEDED